MLANNDVNSSKLLIENNKFLAIMLCEILPNAHNSNWDIFNPSSSTAPNGSHKL